MRNIISAPLSLPRAHLDPIITQQDMLAVLSLAIRRPLCSEVIAILMDEEQRGIGLLSFDEPRSYSSLVHHLIGLCSTAAIASSVILASIRPNELSHNNDVADLRYMQQQCAHAGITLREWFVVSRGAIRCVRSE